jgi:hypothetical protein
MRTKLLWSSIERLRICFTTLNPPETNGLECRSQTSLKKVTLNLKIFPKNPHSNLYSRHLQLGGHEHSFAWLANQSLDGRPVKMAPTKPCVRLGLSPTGDLLRNSNSKWVFNTIPIASNRVHIWKTHFGCQKRHNPNLSILSPGDSFAKKVVFWVLLLEKTKK